MHSVCQNCNITQMSIHAKCRQIQDSYIRIQLCCSSRTRENLPAMPLPISIFYPNICIRLLMKKTASWHVPQHQLAHMKNKNGMKLMAIIASRKMRPCRVPIKLISAMLGTVLALSYASPTFEKNGRTDSCTSNINTTIGHPLYVKWEPTVVILVIDAYNDYLSLAVYIHASCTSDQIW